MAKLLCISNGHGEDSEAAFVLRALHDVDQTIRVVAVPIVGPGAAYRAVRARVAGPGGAPPSGGFTKGNRRQLMADLAGGLVGLSLRQLRAIRHEARDAEAVLAVGDMVAQLFALASGRPFIGYLASLSALYQDGEMGLDLALAHALRSSRCRVVFARDPATAAALQRHGLVHARFAGMPALDFVAPPPEAGAEPLVALMPGSRMPEAGRNMAVLLRLAAWLGAGDGAPRLAAPLVTALRDAAAGAAAEAGGGWRWDGAAFRNPSGIVVDCPDKGYGAIRDRACVVVGMAGQALEEAAASGRPVIQIAGEGPQYTYRFAEAQNRLLGPLAQLFGHGGRPDDPTLAAAARAARAAVDDPATRARSRSDAMARFGGPGGAMRIARALDEMLRAPAAPGVAGLRSA